MQAFKNNFFEKFRKSFQLSYVVRLRQRCRSPLPASSNGTETTEKASEASPLMAGPSVLKALGVKPIAGFPPPGYGNPPDNEQYGTATQKNEANYL